MSATRVLGFSLAALMLFAGSSRATAQDYAYDPPDRVARLAYQSGDVEFAPSGVDDWGSAYRNRPLSTGDRLYTGDNGRAALELGGASVRLDADTALNVFDLDDQAAQFELSQGTINLRVRWLDRGQTYEVDTPTLAFVVSQPGSYRIDVGSGRDGNGTQITVFSGAGQVYGAGGDSRDVRAGRSYRFDGDDLYDVSVMPLPRRDSFDRFCFDRDYRYDHSLSRRYVSADVIGYDDLDDYGDWSYSAGYGEVWYPRQVSYGWAPYHDGRWEWIDPWGWTWVDNAPWGFAPCHYGRWAYIGNRWGWIPGGTSRGAVYAPALVAFIGVSLGGGQPVGWFALSPRDVYQPWYPVSRNYFTTVNVTNVTTINQTVINNYYNSYVNNTTVVNPPGYANRNVPGAVTVVPRDVFTGARPVAAAALRVQPQMLEQAKVTPAVRIAPSMASVGMAATAARPARNTPPSTLFAQGVVARRAPPPAPAPIAQRFNLIANQGGKPLATQQLRELRQNNAETRSLPQRVRIVGSGTENGAPQSSPRTPNAMPPEPRPADRATAPVPRPGEPPSTRTKPQPQPQTGDQPSMQRDERMQNYPPRRDAQGQPPQGDNSYQRGPRTQPPPSQDVQAPRGQDVQARPPYNRDVQAPPRDQGVQERPRPPRDTTMPPPQGDNGYPRDQRSQTPPPQRDVQAPPRGADVQERPRPPRDYQQPQGDNGYPREQRAQTPPPQRDVQAPPREQRTQPAPPRPAAQQQQQQQQTQRPAQDNKENRKPKNKDEQKDKDSQDQQH
jgi:hypothetical protein